MRYGPRSSRERPHDNGSPSSNTRYSREPEDRWCCLCCSGNVAARYTADLAGGELALSGNLYYSTKLFFGPSGIQFPQKAYETLSLRAQWTDPSERFTLALWGDNVTNSRYLTQVQYGNSGVGANWSKPVTYGVEVGTKF